MCRISGSLKKSRSGTDDIVTHFALTQKLNRRAAFALRGSERRERCVVTASAGFNDEAAPFEQDEEARRHFEALAESIKDAYARFTPEEMEMVKWLG